MIVKLGRTPDGVDNRGAVGRHWLEVVRKRGAGALALSVEDAHRRVQQTALTESAVGRVGLELENHVVDLGDPARPVCWDRLEPLPAAVREAAGACAVSREPGGQLELSAPPRMGVSVAVAALRVDLDRVRAALVPHGVGLAPVGTDPLRTPRRANPSDRYRAMEEHFAAVGTVVPGRVTMNATASVQVNLDAGPRRGWPDRVAHAYRLGPVLVAVSAASPWLCGAPTGWQSSRQRAWFGLDQRRCRPFLDAESQRTATDPATAWARFALRAPLMFVRTDDGGLSAVRADVTFEQWVTGEVRLSGRLPTAADLDLHLTTLFPPVRLRGYLELRYLDALPTRWWPAVVAVTTTLMDDPVGADLAAEAAEPTDSLWSQAARQGLADPRLADAASRCLHIAADRVPSELRPAVAELVDLVDSGRSPGDLLAERFRAIGPQAALAELARST